MCQTGLITRNVMRLSRRTYSHRIEAVLPNGYRSSQLQRLNRELDELYELIYNDWQTITEDDYCVFGDQLVIMLQTIKQLHDVCKKLPKAMGIGEQTRRLGMNYSALYELNSDIVNFRIKMPKNKEMKMAMSKLDEVDGKLNGK